MGTVGTLVEFFSEDTVNNVLGAFGFQPERLILILDEGRQKEAAYVNTLRAMACRLPHTAVTCYEADCTDPESISRALETLYSDYPDCVFDFTGGSEPVLLSAFVFARNHDAPMMHIDIRRKRLLSLHRCEALIAEFAFPQLTLEDYLNMNGAFVAGRGHQTLSADEENAVRRFCQLVLSNQAKWKEQCLFLQMAASKAGGLAVDSPLELHTAKGLAVPGDGEYLSRLEQIGMLRDFSVDKKRVRFTFPDDNVRHYLCDSGVWLELYTYLLLKDTGMFSCIRMSVRMGWGEERQQTRGTAYNEIDVIACSGTEALFISCKSGTPTASDLNEILVYAKKFGGNRAKAALVTSAEISVGFVGMRKRAQDLGTVIVDESDLRDGQAARLLLSLLEPGGTQ